MEKNINNLSLRKLSFVGYFLFIFISLATTQLAHAVCFEKNEVERIKKCQSGHGIPANQIKECCSGKFATPSLGGADVAKSESQEPEQACKWTTQTNQRTPKPQIGKDGKPVQTGGTDSAPI